MPAIHTLNRHSRWDKIWQEYLCEVDDQIVEFCEQTGQVQPGQNRHLQGHLREWFVKQDLDQEARLELEQAGNDISYWAEQVESRVRILQRWGRLKETSPRTAAGLAEETMRSAKPSRDGRLPSRAASSRGDWSRGTRRSI